MKWGLFEEGERERCLKGCWNAVHGADGNTMNWGLVEDAKAVGTVSEKCWNAVNGAGCKVERFLEVDGMQSTELVKNQELGPV
ncbi:hypothetical protein OUZ56_000992 [Daphnia magna]|uniref:DUF4189 domain-containing protein n=1 Tax=Daphnia magna TaxID=35525 RepID=A0ABR0A1D2_9CRUS|nr:hypothetical protein OUZ56_000992 [Daphnia magna]